MPAVGRPVSAMGPTFTKMAGAAAKANAEAVERSTRKLGAVVESEGGRFHIKGRNGKGVPLGARTDVKAFSRSQGGVIVNGAVRGTPEGFWSIVEHGSGPHLIAPRGTVKASSKAYFKRAIKSLEDGTLNGRRRALRIGGDFRPFVAHPGHRSIGRPWETSMRIGRPIVAKEHAWEEQRALTKAFTKSII